MGNAAIAWVNLADAGTVRASTALTLTPAARLQDPHVARKWRAQGSAAEYVIVDLGALVPLDTVALLGVNLSAAGATRIRASDSDSSVVASILYDSDYGGPTAGRVDPRYGSLIHPLPSPVSARYVRVDLVEPALPYVEAGRVVVAARSQFSINFGFDWSRGWVDRSRKTEGRGGQIFVDADNAYRVLELSFDYLTQAERWAVLEDVDRVNGEHADVLFLTDPASTNLGRDSVWGLVEGLSAVRQQRAWKAGLPAYAKSFKIRERL